MRWLLMLSLVQTRCPAGPARCVGHGEWLDCVIAGAQHDEALGAIIAAHFRGTGELR
jgi:hypothetical protein